MQPMSSPLKVRQRKHRIWATDASGTVVVDGTTDNFPDRYVAQTATGTWRIVGPPARQRGALVVTDPAGREHARIESFDRREGRVSLASGGSVGMSSSGGLVTAYTCTIEGLSTAKAPRFAPQRYFMLSFDDGVLLRPDGEAIALMAIFASEQMISDAIVRNNE